ncbi:hypothetical protein [Fervidobacterium sp.]
MAKKRLTIEVLIEEAKSFCYEQSKVNHKELLGVNDGKTIGTFIEKQFKEFLTRKYDVQVGNSASGIDLPSADLNTDIKVTSIEQPQSSCPFESARQKIFGLGYNLLVFVYEKIDDTANHTCTIKFHKCTFISKERTGDYTTTKRLREMIDDGANKEDIVAYFRDRGIPGDEIVLEKLAEEVLSVRPEQGYLTISNALQWRLQYSRAINLKNSVGGITNLDFE